MSHAQPQHRGLRARLVEPHAQVGGQPRRRARPGHNRGRGPKGNGPEAQGRGGGGRAGAGPGQDGLDGEGGLEAPGSAGRAWARGVALGRGGPGLEPSAPGSGRPAGSRHGAGHGAALARTDAPREGSRGPPGPRASGERRARTPCKRERDLLARNGPSCRRGLLNLAGRDRAGLGLAFGFLRPRRGLPRAAEPGTFQSQCAPGRPGPHPVLGESRWAQRQGADSHPPSAFTNAHPGAVRERTLSSLWLADDPGPTAWPLGAVLEAEASRRFTCDCADLLNFLKFTLNILFINTVKSKFLTLSPSHSLPCLQTALWLPFSFGSVQELSAPTLSRPLWKKLSYIQKGGRGKTVTVPD